MRLTSYMPSGGAGLSVVLAAEGHTKRLNSM